MIISLTGYYMLATGSTHAWWPKNIWGLNCCLLFTTVILEFENDIPYFPWMFWGCVFLSSSWIAGDTPCSSTWLDVPIRRVISRLWQQSPPVIEENEYPDELLLTSHRVSMDFSKYCRSMLPSLISFTNSYAEEAILIEYLYVIHVMWKASKSGNAAWNLDVHVTGRLKEPVLHILDGSVGSNLWTALFLSKLTTPCMTFREVMIECWAVGFTKKENPIFVMHWCRVRHSFIMPTDLEFSRMNNLCMWTVWISWHNLSNMFMVLGKKKEGDAISYFAVFFISTKLLFPSKSKI